MSDQFSADGKRHAAEINQHPVGRPRVPLTDALVKVGKREGVDGL